MGVLASVGTTLKMHMRCSEEVKQRTWWGGVCPRKDTAGFHLQYSKKGGDKEGDFKTCVAVSDFSEKRNGSLKKRKT